jgi:Legume lectin domain
MRRLIFVLGFLFLAIPAKGNNVYLAQAAAGTGDGSSCANARAASYFNSASSYGTGTTQIGSGTTVHLCGTISTSLTVPASSGTGLITVKWETGAKLSQTNAQSFITVGSVSTNAWKFDGGFPCGPQPGSVVTCNGIIENTANGTDRAHQTYPAKAFNTSFAQGTVEITGLDIRNLYVHTPTVKLTSVVSNGTSTVTATCSGPCGKVVGEQHLSVSDSTVTAQNLACNNCSGGITVASVAGSNITFTYPTTVASGTSSVGSLSDGIILNTSVNCVGTNPLRANLIIHDGDCHDVSWAFTATADASSNGALYEVYNEDIYNADHDFVAGSGGTTPTYTFKLHDSHLHSWKNWDTAALPVNTYHHDGLHFFNAEGADIAGYIYNNVFDDWDGFNNTAPIFDQSSFKDMSLFNNVFICDPNQQCVGAPLALHEGGAGVNHLMINNTFIQSGVTRVNNGSQNGACVQSVLHSGSSSGNNSFINNIATSCNTMMVVTSAIFAANTATAGLHHNLYANRITDGNKAFNWNGTQTDDFATWKSLSGEGTGSMFVASAGIDSAGVPQPGSAAIGAGANLTSLCTGNLVALCSDTSAGNSRVPTSRSTTAPWDIGAYQSTSGASINFGSGFSATGMAFNGSAALNGTRLRLTSGLQSQTGSGWFTTLVNVQSFTTDFNFQITNPNADGMTFAIQNAGTGAIGACGGGLAYGSDPCSTTPGIPTSVAVKFDLFQNHLEGTNSTGLYTNGAPPTTPATTLGNGVDLHSGDTMHVHITYDGTTLTLTITDTVTNATFTTSWPINIPSTVGANTAYAGFTGATGGQTCTAEIITWTFSN